MMRRALLILAFVLAPVSLEAADRFAKTAGGNWSAAGTWSATASAGLDNAGAPTAADNVIFDATSGNVTIDAAAVARSVDMDGAGPGIGSYMGTLTHNAGITLSIGDATAGTGNIALRMVAGMTYTLGSTNTSILKFVSTSATQQTIVTAGKLLSHLQFIDGVGGSWIFSDGVTTTSGASSGIDHRNGTLNVNGQTVAVGWIQTVGTAARNLTLGAATLNLSHASCWFGVLSGLTFPAHTATITCSAAAATFTGGGLTYGGTVNLTGSGAATVVNANTFATLTRTGTAVKTDSLVISGANQTVTGTFTVTGNSVVNRVLVSSETVGTARTVTAAAVSLTNADFMDITGAGAASPFTGTSLGNALGNSSITFDAPTTQTHDGTTSNWSTAARWTSRVPLPQDTVIISSGTGTVTNDMPRLGANLTFTGFTGTLALGSVTATTYGNVVLASGMTITGAPSFVLAGRGAQTFTSATKAFPAQVSVNAFGGSYTLQDAFVTNQGFVFLNGTFTTGNMAVTTSNLVGTTSATTRVLNLGSSTWTLTATAAANIWGIGTALTVNAGTSTLVISTASANTRTFVGAGQTYHNLTYTVANSPGSLTVTGANTFTGTVQVGSGRIVTMPSSTTTTLQGPLTASGAVNGYVYLPGVAGNYASAPDSVPLSITGDITIDAKVALDDWTPAAIPVLVSKARTSGNQQSYGLRVDAAGTLTLYFSVAGSTLVTKASTVANGVSDGATKWVRASLDVDNGAAGYDVKFYLSDDGSVWTQLGTTVTTATATSVFDSTAPLDIGSYDGGVSNHAAGKVYEAKVYASDLGSGSGTPVFHANFETKTVGANTFTESSANAATVTINGTLARVGDGRISLVSSTPGTAATVIRNQGPTVLNYLSVQDWAVQGAWYPGANSFNISGNTGFRWTPNKWRSFLTGGGS